MATQTAAPPGAAGSGELHVHLALAWDEAQRGCTRVVEVDGRLEWLDIPAGAEDGQELRFEGRGPAGAEGGPHGDLLVSLEVGPEPVPGEEIGVKLPVTPLEALTGGRKTVEVHGRLVWVRIPPNVASGQVIRMKGEGGHGEHGGARGDLVVVLEVSDSFTIPAFEPDEETLTLATSAAMVPYRPPAAPSRARLLWPLVTVVAAAGVGGLALFFLGRTEGQASGAQPAPLPPLSAPAALPAGAMAGPGAVPEPAPEPTPTPAPPKPPGRRVEPPALRPERPAARRPARRPTRQPRAFRAPARREPSRRPAAPAARFCGGCGRRIAGGSFCGSCGRKI